MYLIFVRFEWKPEIVKSCTDKVISHVSCNPSLTKVSNYTMLDFNTNKWNVRRISHGIQWTRAFTRYKDTKHLYEIWGKRHKLELGSMQREICVVINMIIRCSVIDRYFRTRMQNSMEASFKGLWYVLVDD